MKQNIIKKFKSKLIFGKYSIKKLIAKGTFGEVYLGTNIYNNKEYALKIELMKNGESYLKQETFILFSIKGPGIPSVISFGVSDHYHILVENLLGQSIYDIWLNKKKKLNIKDTAMFAIQALERIEYVHSKNYLHRDIKPGNFLVGNPDKSQIYLIDFGNARKYRSSKTGKHLPFIKNNKVFGTALFLSSNNLKGIEQTRKDELESLGLVFIYLSTGTLPWAKIKYKSMEQALEKINDIKSKISNQELCKGMPKEMYEYMNYVTNLNYKDNPNYTYLRELFLNILENIGEKNDLMFSWIDKKIAPKKIISKSNSKTMSKLYQNLLNINKNKSESYLKTDLKGIDNKITLSENYSGNDMLKTEKINKSPYSENNKLNQIKTIYKTTTDEKYLNPKPKIVSINIENKDDNNKNNYIYKTIDNNISIKRNNKLINNNGKYKIKRIKLDKMKENLKVIKLNKKNLIPKPISGNTINGKTNLFYNEQILKNPLKDNNYKINNRNYNDGKKQLKANDIISFINNSNNKIKINNNSNYININNININNPENNNISYMNIFKKLDSPKINNIPKIIINNKKTIELKEYKNRNIKTEGYNQNDSFGDKPKNINKFRLYKSIFSPKFDYNSKGPISSKMLINKKYIYNNEFSLSGIKGKNLTTQYKDESNVINPLLNNINYSIKSNYNTKPINNKKYINKHTFNNIPTYDFQ